MIPNDDVRSTGSRDQRTISGWTSLHSWIFLAIVLIAVLVIGIQNRYHYLSPLGLGKAYRIDKLFGGIQEYDPSNGWIVAQLQPMQPMPGTSPETSPAVPMHMPGTLPTPPGTVGLGTSPTESREQEAPPAISKETPKAPSRGKEAQEMSLDERAKLFSKAFPEFGKEEFQLANDDLYPDWKKNVAPKGSWPEFLGVYREFVQWWTDQGSPQETGPKLWKDFWASRGRR